MCLAVGKGIGPRRMDGLLGLALEWGTAELVIEGIAAGRDRSERELAGRFGGRLRDGRRGLLRGCPC
jgi:hypothetical protein